MSVGFNLFLHLLFVLFCIGLGYVLRWSMEEFKELDAQIARMNKPEQEPQAAVQPHTAKAPPALPNMQSTLQAKADPAKLAELKATIKK